MMTVTYEEIYKQLDDMTALAVANSTPLKKRKNKTDNEFVKRIVAGYMMHLKRGESQH